MDIINNIYLNGAVVLFLFSLSFYLGLMAFSRNRKSPINLLFTRFSIATAFWILLAYIPDFPLLHDFGLISGKLNYVALLIVGYSLFEFPFVFPRTRSLHPIIRYGLLCIGLGLSGVTLLTDQVLKGLQYFHWGASYIDGDLAGMFYLYMLLGVISAIVQYSYLWRRFDYREKTQVKLFAIGLAIFMVTNIFVQSVVKPLITHTDEFYKVGNYSVIFMITLTGYAIIKHRFMDIRLIVARTASYTLLVGVFGLFYAFSFAILSSFFIGSSMAYRTIAISTLLALIMAFSFQSVRRFLEKITDRVLYRDKYDMNQILYKLALIMASTLRLEDLTQQILQELLREVRITRGAFILVEKDQVFKIVHEGYDRTPEINKQDIWKMLGWYKTLIFEEVPEGSEKELMRRMEFTLVTPLLAEGKYIGIIALGEKLSGDLYTSEDSKLIEILAPEAAVAIQNSKAYEEIKRFNITLKEEVEKATTDLKAANAKLKVLDKLKDDFVSIASHELRTPMTAIKSYLWMALKRPDVPLSEKMTRYISRSYISTERLINLVNDMLNVSRIESGRIEISPQTFDIMALVSEVMTEVGAKASEKGINLHTLNNQPPRVFADPDKVHQVLLNLIGNSLKFTPSQGSITVSFFTDGRTVEVSVKDTGTGIAQDDMSRLFQKFERLDSSYVSAATSGGTGLGLFISKSLVELMGGKIWAKSDGVGKGTTFTFSLPVANKEVLSQAEKYTKKPIGEVKTLEPVAI